MKKIHLTIFFQLIALTLIVKVLFFDEVEYDKLLLLKTDKIILLIIFSIIIKLLITFLFFNILNIFSTKKLRYSDINLIHLQGGLINDILPGVGYAFRYYKLKLYSNIDILKYSVSQSIFSLSLLVVYFSAATLLGFLIIASYANLVFFVIMILISFIFILQFRYKFYNIIKKILLRHKKTSYFVNDLKNIKKLLSKNKKKLFLIFIGFIILVFLECYTFYLGLKFLDVKISFFNSNYIFITTTLLTALTLINFFGKFELILVLSAALIVPEISYILIFAVNLRIINLFSLILLIIKCSVLKKILDK
tara:strand:+ start:308 stop:1228 length:921 start_codon:yes stop_codon:yes gene_type:complete